jgi:prefoldin beta subunit
MDLDQETNKKIEELQALESRLQAFLGQKQMTQLELNEIENAIAELENSGEEVYKVFSGVMLKSDKNKLSEELEEKKKVLEARIESFEKQEKILEKNASELREEVRKSVSGKR